MKNIRKSKRKTYTQTGTIPPSKNQLLYTPNHALEWCLPAEPSTQADIMSRGPTSTDIAYHTTYQFH